MFGYSSITPPMVEKIDGKPRGDLSLYDTFAKRWVDDGLRIWQAYKYAVWKCIYNDRSRGIEPAVIFRSGSAIGNDGKKHQFKAYGEYYKSIYQYSMKVNSDSPSALALGRKKAVYGYPEY